MPVTQEQVDAAWNAMKAAEAELTSAQAALKAAQPYTPAFETAKVAEQAARTNLSNARQELNRVSSAYRQQNPIKPPPGQAEADRVEEARQRQKNASDPTYGIPDTDRERQDRIERNAPKPARTDSPVQIQTANNTAASNAETGRHNQQTEAQAAINSQRDALVAAGTLYNNTREQISRENQARIKAEQDNIAGTVGAATTLVDDATRRRGQDIDAQKARSSFVQDVLTTAMPAVVQLMLKTPKGSKAASNFLKAFLVMANESYQKAQLGNIPPPLDMNSPEMRTLTQRAGYPLPDRLPSMPTSNQISQQTVQATAVGGFPPPGYQGPVGVGAAALPEAPGSGQPSTTRNGAGIDPVAEAAHSPEGQAVLQGLKAQVGPIEAKLKAGQPITPQEQQMLDSAKASYNEQMRKLAAQRQQRAAQANSAQGGPQQDLKTEVRATLTGGDPNQKLKLMALASTAVENQQAGKPLSEAEVAILANLDPQDLQIVTQNMTPEIRQILLKHQNGQPVTPEERKRVETAVIGTTEGIKARPVAAPVVPSTPVTGTEQARSTETAGPSVPAPGDPPARVGSQPAVSPGLPEGAPPQPKTGDAVLVKDSTGVYFWVSRPMVPAGRKIEYDPKGPQAEMPTPLEGPTQAKIMTPKHEGPLPTGEGTMFAGNTSTETGTPQDPYSMPRELPQLFGPRREPEDMVFDNFPTPEIAPQESMPQLFDPYAFRRRNEEEEDQYAPTSLFDRWTV